MGLIFFVVSYPPHPLSAHTVVLLLHTKKKKSSTISSVLYLVCQSVYMTKYLNVFWGDFFLIIIIAFLSGKCASVGMFLSWGGGGREPKRHLFSGPFALFPVVSVLVELFPSISWWWWWWLGGGGQLRLTGVRGLECLLLLCFFCCCFFKRQIPDRG